MLLPADALKQFLQDKQAFADRLEQYGADGPAEGVRETCQQLATRIDELAEEELTPAQVAEEMGLTKDRVRRKIGMDWPNTGEKGRPRTLRKYLYEDSPAEPTSVDQDATKTEVADVVEGVA